MRVLALLFSCFCLASAADLDYGRDIRPILSENCFHCHGQDSKKRMAGLRLDESPSGAAVHADKILDRITTANKARQMPPAYSNRTLTSDQKALLKRWLDEGGKYSKHWAFVPPVAPPVPSGAANPIDAFVLRKLQAEGLKPSPAAKPAAWLRRASLDLTGIPPTLAEIDAFEKDAAKNGDGAYARTVDRLLASPHYGERMAIDWLDVARYADTHGFNNDSEREMWRWRDWVIQAFNSNQRYDRFLTEQLAGDLLPNPTLEQRIATGYGRNHVINSEGGIIEEEYRVEYVSDRVRTLGMSWLGLTLECARCHDHKYDPITQKDHYRFFAFFNNVPEFGEDGRVANAVPMIPAPTPDQQRRIARLQADIAKLEQVSARLSAGWKFKPMTPPAPPADVTTALNLDCNDGPAPGIQGNACIAKDAKTPAVPIARRNPLAFRVWLQSTAADTDAPILSTIDYSKNEAAVGYASGTELRLVNGEVELRLSQRFPAYALRVQSEGARIGAGEWRHVTVVYPGVAAEPDAMRMKAAWVRMYIDGREVPTRILNDGASLPSPGEKPSNQIFKLGWDNAGKSGTRFQGKLDNIQILTRDLKPEDAARWFESDALPYALSRTQRSPVETAWIRTYALKDKNKPLDDLKAELYAVRRASPMTMVMQELEGTPRPTHLLLRGQYNLPGEKLEPGVPESLLGAWPAGAPKNRLGLAQWLTKPDHPLTSRVVVNRFWQQLFGQGLVKTSDNFGFQGEFPSHPELLDWLARDFVDNGWNVKALMRKIVLSATYRQDAAGSPELTARDPENRLLARGPRFRLPAELIRDQALAISGLLTEKLGGPSVYPLQAEDLYKGIVVAADYPGTKYITSKGPDLYRRSMYTFWKRTVTHPAMTVFDAPDREFCIVKRSTTNTPLQALTLLNDPIYVEAARKLAERALREDAKAPIAYAFRLATGRQPDERESQILRTSYEKLLQTYENDRRSAEALLTVGPAPRDPKIPTAQLAAYTGVANMILNLDEVITK
ncbi:hypothetical protein F183_A11580 [Bryobacterales bacterium F-183]|nr:hypothetical protein F183_A11580 [Bryobacterales bacterium F-183]